MSTKAYRSAAQPSQSVRPAPHCFKPHCGALVRADTWDPQAQATQCHLALIEKLLDIHVNDVLSASCDEMRGRERAAAFSSCSAVSFEHSARAALRAECRATAAAATAPSATIASLRRLACMSPAETRADIHRIVAARVDPHIDAFFARRRRSHGDTLHSTGIRDSTGISACGPSSSSSCGNGRGLRSVAAAVCAAVGAERAAVRLRRCAARDELAQADREHRVRLAWAALKKDVGCVAALRYVAPEPYALPAAEAAAAALQRLRVQLRALHDEEAQLRAAALGAAAAADGRLRAAEDEVAALRATRRALSAEIARRREQGKEQIEKRDHMDQGAVDALRLAAQQAEAQRLRAQRDALCRQLSSLSAAQSAAAAEAAQDEAELCAACEEKRNIAAALRAGLDAARAAVLRLRRQQRDVVREINALRGPTAAVGAFGAFGPQRVQCERQKQCARLLAAAACVALEESLHSRLAAQLRWERVTARGTDNNNNNNNNKERDKEKRWRSFDRVVALAKERARYEVAGTTADSAALEEGITVCHGAVVRLRGEIARRRFAVCSPAEQSAISAARVIERQLAALRVREETVLSQAAALQVSALCLGVAWQALPAALPKAETMRRDVQRLYAEAAHALHREGRARAVLRILREAAERRARGEAVQCLTRRAHSTAAQSAAGDVRQSDENGGADGASAPQGNALHGGPTLSLDTVSSVRTADLQPAAALRKVVVQFIKNEIQPLYDTNQISRIRFMEVVERVSSWFMETNPVTLSGTTPPYLTSVDRENISRRIQETLTWQDEQRLQLHS